MKATERRLLIGGEKELFVHKEDGKLLISNSHWLITDKEAERFLEGIIPAQLLGDGKHRLEKKGSSWRLSGGGPDMLFLLERHIPRDDDQRFDSTKLAYIATKAENDALLLLGTYNDIVPVKKSYWHVLRDVLYPNTWPIQNRSNRRAPIAFWCAKSKVVKALLMPMSDGYGHKDEFAGIQALRDVLMRLKEKEAATVAEEE